MGIPVPSRLTPAEVDACDRFSVLVWGKLLFDREPSHNGRHGYACEHCWEYLKAFEDALEARKSPPQPWEHARAA